MAMSFVRVFFEEVLIICRYSIFPTLLSLLLTFLDWNYGMVMSVINLLVFLRIVHNEDQRTGIMHFKFIFLKLVTATLLWYLTDYAATYLEENFLPPGLFARSQLRNSPQDGLPPSTKVKISRTKATPVNDVFQRAKFLIGRIVIEYLLVTSSCANYRFFFLLLIFIIYGGIHVVIWCFVPPPKYPNEEDDADSSDSEE